MQNLQEPHDDRVKKNSRYCQIDNARVQSEGTGKQFCGCPMQTGHRTHATENHAGIEQAVDPIDFPKKMVTQDTDPQRDGHKTQTNGGVAELVPNKLRSTAQTDALQMKWFIPIGHCHNTDGTSPQIAAILHARACPERKRRPPEAQRHPRK